MKGLFIILSAFLIVGCSNQEESESQPENADQATEDQVSVAFRAIDVTVENNNIHIKGEVKSTEDTFYYTVEQGEDMLIVETAITLNEKIAEWGEFELEVPITAEVTTNEEVPFITLYGKDNNKIINPNYVPVDLKND